MRCWPCLCRSGLQCDFHHLSPVSSNQRSQHVVYSPPQNFSASLLTLGLQLHAGRSRCFCREAHATARMPAVLAPLPTPACLPACCSKSKISFAEAARIAAEIERGNHSSVSNIHMMEERGVAIDDSQMDEEDRYGAVVRDAPAAAARAGAGAPCRCP